jgi:hypothetical protein
MPLNILAGFICMTEISCVQSSSAARVAEVCYTRQLGISLQDHSLADYVVTVLGRTTAGLGK